MFLIFHGPMKNEHGDTAIEYTAINLDHFRGRHRRDEPLRRQDQSRAEQRGGALLFNRPARTGPLWWAASLLHFRGKQ